MFCFEKSTSSFAENWRAHGVLPGTGEAVPGGGCEAAGEDETGLCAGDDAAGCAGLVCGKAPGAGEAGALLAGAAAAWGSGVAIGPAGAGFRCANSAAANSMARSIGI